MRELLALGVIGAGAYYLWTSGALNDLLNQTGLGSTVALTPEQQRAQQAAQQAVIATADDIAAFQQRQQTGIDTARGGIGLTLGAAGSTAGVATGLASAGAIAGSTALLATGIGAAGALLVWGITQKGWFRGGEEGIRVNPARDDFMNEFVKVYAGDPFSFSREQINSVRYESMLKAMTDARIPAATQEQLMRMLYAADTMTEFEAAAKAILAELQKGLR